MQQLGIKPHRSLDDDMKLQTNVMSYGGNGKTMSLPVTTAEKAATPGSPPNFATMTSAEKLAYHQARLKRVFG